MTKVQFYDRVDDQKLKFAVIVTRITGDMRGLVEEKVAQLNALLGKPDGDLQPLSLSVGAAFSDREAPDGDVYQDADAALERLRKAGRTGCEFF